MCIFAEIKLIELNHKLVVVTVTIVSVSQLLLSLCYTEEAEFKNK
jgi:hypothetical protein